MPIPVSDILTHLQVMPTQPDLPLLNKLLMAWSKRIGWESASRIARHLLPGAPDTYARLPEGFFKDALRLHTGGTCFESNLASRALLRELGFIVRLAFCDMQGEAPNPHCALIAELDGKQYLADVGFPVPSALQLDEQETTGIETPAYWYSATPSGPQRWTITRQSGAFESECFVVKGDPIDDERFQERLIRDHQPDGLFLDQVILSQVRADHILRYSEGKGLVKRTLGREETIELSPEQQADLATSLSALFGMSRTVVQAALTRSASPGLAASFA